MRAGPSRVGLAPAQAHRIRALLEPRLFHTVGPGRIVAICLTEQPTLQTQGFGLTGNRRPRSFSVNVGGEGLDNAEPPEF